METIGLWFAGGCSYVMQPIGKWRLNSRVGASLIDLTFAKVGRALVVNSFQVRRGS